MTAIGLNMFGPDNNGTNMEVAAMLYSLLAGQNITYSSLSRFADIDYSNPLTANIINFVSSQDYMAGNDLGLFNAAEPITRAEMAVVVCKVLRLLQEYSGPLPLPSAFADTEGHWSGGYVFLAAIRGVMSGYNEDGVMLFKPDNNITRAELAFIFNAMFNRSGEPMGSIDFTDVPPEHWAYRVIMNAAITDNQGD